MRTRVIGYLCFLLVVFVSARYHNLEAEGIDADLDVLEQPLNARNEAAYQKRENELQNDELLEGIRDLDLNDLENLTDKELQELQKRLSEYEANIEARRLADEDSMKRGSHHWGWPGWPPHRPFPHPGWPYPTLRRF